MMETKKNAKNVLIVVDMQNDFITGALANPEGQKIVSGIAELVKTFNGDIIATRDTHFYNYRDTQEGKRLPVCHCIKETEGWQIVPEITSALCQRITESLENSTRGTVTTIDKYSFGSNKLGEIIAKKRYANVELVGVCTDICVISNALIIKAYAPEATVIIHKNLCAGVTPESHEIALKAMAACQCDIVD